MNIDADIEELVDDMQPKSLGQRVALEQTLQRKRDANKPVTASADFKLTPKEMEKLKQLFTDKTQPQPTFIGNTMGQQMIQIPSNILRAIIRSVGGCITLDQHDLTRDTDEELEFLMYSDPSEKVVIRIKEADDAGDPGDREGYHGFSGVH